MQRNGTRLSLHFGRRCAHRVGIRPLAAPGPRRRSVTWPSEAQDLMLGGVAPPDSPVRLGCISPGQRLARTDGGIRRSHDLV